MFAAWGRGGLSWRSAVRKIAIVAVGDGWWLGWWCGSLVVCWSGDGGRRSRDRLACGLLISGGGVITLVVKIWVFLHSPVWER